MSEDARLSIVVEAKLDKLTEALNRANGQVDGFARRGQKAFDDLRAQVDPVGLAADRMAAKIAVADKALAASKITATQHAQALALAKKSYEDVKKAADDAAKGIQTVGGFNRAQIAELTHSGKAMFDMIAAGQSPLRATQVEAARLGQALSSGEGGLGGGLKSLAALAFTPIAGLVALGASILALVGIEQKYEAQQRQTQVTLRGYGAASGATVGDIEKIADAASSAGQATHDLAVSAETAFLKAGASKDQLAPALAVLKDFAALSGQDVPEAMKTLAGAIQDPIKFVDEFGGSLLNLTAAQIEHIHKLVEQGEKSKAVAELIRDVGAASKGAGEDLKNGLGKALDALKDKFSEVISSFAQLLYQMTHSLPAAARLADLQKQRAEVAAQGAVAGKVDTGPFLAALDKRIAAAQAEVAKDTAQKAPAVNAAAAAKRGRETDALVDQAAPDVKRRRELVERRAGLVGRLGDPGAGSSYTSADIQKAIKDTDRQIADLDKKGVTKPKKARQGPEDQTATLDASATQALDRAQQEYLRSLLALTTDLRERADLEKQSVDANAQKEIDRLDAEIAKAKKAELEHKDKNAAGQIAKDEQAKTLVRLAAENQKELIDRQAIVNLANEELRRRQEIDRYYDQIDSITASMAKTARERRDLELASLARRKADEDRAARVAHQNTLTLIGSDPAKQGERDAENSRYGADRGAANDLYGKQQEQVRRSNMSPLEAWRDQSLRTAAQINEAYESVAARGLDALTNGITDAITGTKSLGDAFSEVARGIIADLVRIAVQRSITQPLADALFPGGGAVSSLLGGIFGHHATGASSFGGGLTHLNELGPEGVAYLPKGTQIIPNDIMRQLSRGVQTPQAAPMPAPLHFDMRGAVVTEDLLGQMQRLAAQARAGAVADARMLVPSDARSRQRFILPS